MILWFNAPGLGKVRVIAVDDQFGIEVDGNKLTTPKERDILVPTKHLAERVAQEIITIGVKPQGAKIPESSLLHLQLAITAIDLIQGAEQQVARDLFDLLPLDMLLFRSPSDELFDLQKKKWDKIIKWAEKEFELKLSVSTTFQLPEVKTPAKLHDFLEGQDYYKLMGLSHLTALSGSLLLSLALHNGYTDPVEAFELLILEETFQAEQWGKDDIQEERHMLLRREFEQTAGFLNSLQ